MRLRIVGEVNQRDHGERELHAEDHLAQKDELRKLLLEPA